MMDDDILFPFDSLHAWSDGEESSLLSAPYEFPNDPLDYAHAMNDELAATLPSLPYNNPHFGDAFLPGTNALFSNHEYDPAPQIAPHQHPLPSTTTKRASHEGVQQNTKAGEGGKDKKKQQATKKKKKTASKPPRPAPKSEEKQVVARNRMHLQAKMQAAKAKEVGPITLPLKGWILTGTPLPQTDEDDDDGGGDKNNVEVEQLCKAFLFELGRYVVPRMHLRLRIARNCYLGGRWERPTYYRNNLMGGLARFTRASFVRLSRVLQRFTADGFDRELVTPLTKKPWLVSEKVAAPWVASVVVHLHKFAKNLKTFGGLVRHRDVWQGMKEEEAGGKLRLIQRQTPWCNLDLGWMGKNNKLEYHCCAQLFSGRVTTVTAAESRVEDVCGPDKVLAENLGVHYHATTMLLERGSKLEPVPGPTGPCVMPGFGPHWTAVAENKKGLIFTMTTVEGIERTAAEHGKEAYVACESLTATIFLYRRLRLMFFRVQALVASLETVALVAAWLAMDTVACLAIEDDPAVEHGKLLTRPAAQASEEEKRMFETRRFLSQTEKALYAYRPGLASPQPPPSVAPAPVPPVPNRSNNSASLADVARLPLGLLQFPPGAHAPPAASAAAVPPPTWFFTTRGRVLLVVAEYVGSLTDENLTAWKPIVRPKTAAQLSPFELPTVLFGWEEAHLIAMLLLETFVPFQVPPGAQEPALSTHRVPPAAAGLGKYALDSHAYGDECLFVPTDRNVRVNPRAKKVRAEANGEALPAPAPPRKPRNSGTKRKRESPPPKFECDETKDEDDEADEAKVAHEKTVARKKKTKQKAPKSKYRRPHERRRAKHRTAADDASSDSSYVPEDEEEYEDEEDDDNEVFDDDDNARRKRNNRAAGQRRRRSRERREGLGGSGGGGGGVKRERASTKQPVSVHIAAPTQTADGKRRWTIYVEAEDDCVDLVRPVLQAGKVSLGDGRKLRLVESAELCEAVKREGEMMKKEEDMADEEENEENAAADDGGDDGDDDDNAPLLRARPKAVVEEKVADVEEQPGPSALEGGMAELHLEDNQPEENASLQELGEGEEEVVVNEQPTASGMADNGGGADGTMVKVEQPHAEADSATQDLLEAPTNPITTTTNPSPPKRKRGVCKGKTKKGSRTRTSKPRKRRRARPVAPTTTNTPQPPLVATDAMPGLEEPQRLSAEFCARHPDLLPLLNELRRFTAP